MTISLILNYNDNKNPTLLNADAKLGSDVPSTDPQHVAYDFSLHHRSSSTTYRSQICSQVRMPFHFGNHRSKQMVEFMLCFGGFVHLCCSLLIILRIQSSS
ncbi:hypothetical protein BD410DRAFT_306919 [Rickenella mellea]|uniref:Uncharacterized protein n=1 Tax=Rickenella mellea TaxID=50990 RepID=A0A4Y7Q2R2_9AGAM|nr:hypothetical protein BD410DRAFT_306919 [Rickenella mellea]